jgi:alkaline phosphatase
VRVPAPTAVRFTARTRYRNTTRAYVLIGCQPCVTSLHARSSAATLARVTRRAALLVLLSLLAFATPARPQAPAAVEAHARHVILFLADAGGIPTIHAASLLATGSPRGLFVQRMPHLALVDTSAADEWVTDSAAGMTAIVTGRKTNNGVLAQGPDAVRKERDGTPLQSILDYAEARGLSTGIVTTDSVAGATPAALYAKVNDRGKAAEIVLQAFAPRRGDGVDVLIGGGRSALAQAVAQTGRDLSAAAAAVRRPLLTDVSGVPAGARRAIVLYEDAEFDLAAAVRTARTVLARNPRGSFLMVECDVHTDRVRQGLERMVAFDRIIRETAAGAGADTLVLFTADHSFDLRVHDGATGGNLLEGLEAVPEAAEGQSVESLRLPNLSMDGTHTGEPVMAAAQGPGAFRVRGYLANTDLFGIMLRAYGWRDARTAVRK